MTAKLVRRLNIAHFERLLLTPINGSQRDMVHRLLAEEKTKADSAYPICRL